MKIVFSPVFVFAPEAPAPLALRRDGDTLTVNGASVDLSALADGHYLPSRDDETGEMIEGTGHPEVVRVNRRDGQLTVWVRMEHTTDAPEAVRFPEPVEMEGDGPVPVPGS